jgi:hypothetical protein
LASEKKTDKLTNNTTFKIAKIFLVIENANPVNTHQIIVDFSGLEVNRVRQSKQAIAFNKLGARSSNLNLVPLPYNSTSEMTIMASAIHL